MRRYAGAFAALALVLTVGPAATGAGGPPQGTQTNAAFEASYTDAHVSSVSATTQRTSCYRPEVDYDGKLDDNLGYPGGGSSPCPAVAPASAPFTGEQTTDFATQDRATAANRVLLVKDHSESESASTRRTRST